MWQLLVGLCCLAPASVFAWNLATTDGKGLNFITNNNDYVVMHVSVFYVRAFLSIRNRGNSTKNPITLIESTWPENLLPIQPRIFPGDLSHAKSDWECNGILQSVYTAIDRNGMLWLIDNGSAYCPPKLIIFNLLKLNVEVHRHVFNDFSGNSFKSIYIQNRHDPNDEAFDCRAVITLWNEPFLIFFSLKDRKYRKLFLLPHVVPQHLAIRHNDHVLIADEGNVLWEANLDRLKYRTKENEWQLFVEVKRLGPLLGPVQSLAVPSRISYGDPFNDYLYYHLPRDGAIVRWDFRQPLTAEGHDVLYFLKATVVQIIFGAKGSVWVVREQPDEFSDHCVRVFNPFPTPSGGFVL